MTYASEVLADSPSWYINLDADATDQSGNSRNGTAVSGVTYGQAGPIADRPNGAAAFSGTTSSITVPYIAADNSSERTFETWIKTTTSGRYIYSRDLSGSAKFMWLLITGGKCQFGYYDYAGTAHTVNGAKTINDGAWHHVVVVMTKCNNDLIHCDLYIDGALDTSYDGPVKTAQQTASEQNVNHYIGTRRNSAYFQGSQDEAAYYNHALTAGRVAAHYNAGLALTPTSYEFYAPIKLVDNAAQDSPSQYFTVPTGVQASDHMLMVIQTSSSVTRTYAPVIKTGTGSLEATPVISQSAGNDFVTMYRGTGFVAGDTIWLNGNTVFACSVGAMFTNDEIGDPGAVGVRSASSFDNVSGIITLADGDEAIIVSVERTLADGGTAVVSTSMSDPLPTIPYFYEETGATNTTNTTLIFVPFTASGAGDRTATITYSNDSGNGLAVIFARGTAGTTPPVALVAKDTFTRTEASGWGTAEIGGDWRGTTLLSANGSEGLLSFTAGGQGASPALDAVSIKDLDCLLTLKMSQMPTAAPLYFTPHLRGQSICYKPKMRIQSGAINLQWTKNNGTDINIDSSYTTMLSGVAANDRVNFRFQVFGDSPTTLRGKAWFDGDPEPSVWVENTDTDSAIISASNVSFEFYLSGSAGVFPQVSLDDLYIYQYGQVPVEDQPPNATISASPNPAEPWDTVSLTLGESDDIGVASRSFSQTSGPVQSVSGTPGDGQVMTFEAPAIIGGTTLTFQYQVTDTASQVSTATVDVHILTPATTVVLADGSEKPLQVFVVSP